MSLSRVINCNHYVSLMAKYKCITLFTNDFNQKDILQAWTFLLVELRCCPITGGISPLIHWLILLPKRLLICCHITASSCYPITRCLQLSYYCEIVFWLSYYQTLCLLSYYKTLHLVVLFTNFARCPFQALILLVILLPIHILTVNAGTHSGSAIFTSHRSRAEYKAFIAFRSV